MPVARTSQRFDAALGQRLLDPRRKLIEPRLVARAQIVGKSTAQMPGDESGDGQHRHRCGKRDRQHQLVSEAQTHADFVPESGL
ncbi:MAG: hypothetical protein R3E87_09255 [Burkholderiaceae bacterium]